MKLGDLISGLAVGTVSSRDAAVRVCDVTEDSRTVVPGSLFIARAGHKADGKRFVRDALLAGAVAVLTDDDGLRCPEGFEAPVIHTTDIARVSAVAAERFYAEPSSRLSLVGVTGTNGKTTTTYVVWQMLNAAGKRCGLIGTVVIDDGREVAPATMTTPPSVELSRSLATMLEGGCCAASLEVSSHALDQSRAAALRFRVGVFTNLTGDHLDYHGTMEAYASAKARLFEGLGPEGTAVVNADDPAHERMIRACRARVVRCSATDTGADARVAIEASDMEGMGLLLGGPWGTIRRRVGLIGRYNAMNVLQAVASCHALGLTREQIEESLAHVHAPPGRLERVSVASDAVRVFVDYAHSDDSLRSVLRAVGDSMPGRHGASVRSRAGSAGVREAGGSLWVVFGCGGDRDRTKRPRMGLAAVELADRVIVTSDNPRTERPGAIIDEVLAGIPGPMRAKVDVHADRARAIRLAIEGARPGDVVVIAGKGHETEQVLPDGAGGTIRTHFDDREVARSVLAEHRAGPTVETKPGRREPRGTR